MKRHNKLIGIAGPAGAGKTTAATLLSAQFGYAWIGFADPIREALLRLVSEWDCSHFGTAIKDVKQWVRLCPRDVWIHLRAHLYLLQNKVVSVATPDEDAETWVAVFELISEWGPSTDREAVQRVSLSPRHALRTFGDFARGHDPWIYIHDLHERLQEVERDDYPGAVVHDVRMPAEAAYIREQGGIMVHISRPGFDYSKEHASEYGPGFALGDLVVGNEGNAAALRRRLTSDLAYELGRVA